VTRFALLLGDDFLAQLAVVGERAAVDNSE
jgi:hypothetical protein